MNGTSRQYDNIGVFVIERLFDDNCEAYYRGLMMIMNRTSICGTPLGAGGNPLSSNSPKSLFAAAISLSPAISVEWSKEMSHFK